MLDRLNFNSTVIPGIFFFLLCKSLSVLDEIKKIKEKKRQVLVLFMFNLHHKIMYIYYTITTFLKQKNLRRCEHYPVHL